ncbi:hypothetical protein Cni_G08906 [Canna indica]|uniref:Uncharacterized protein n=1 Tax=Canna indica TaxID=4628 RepID=A0AAQ3Q8U8_9LILI|nr:hypothetical protein Cni_G08906 [Canna indica]
MSVLNQNGGVHMGCQLIDLKQHQVAKFQETPRTPIICWFGSSYADMLSLPHYHLMLLRKSFFLVISVLYLGSGSYICLNCNMLCFPAGTCNRFGFILSM